MSATYHDVNYRLGLEARIYQPLGGGLFPALVAVHGGSWISGNRFMHERAVEHLARHGIAVMAIEFRMPPEARYPEPIADVAAAIAWLRHNARTYRIDAPRIGGFGLSSGAHQLLLAALRPSDPRWSAAEDGSCAFLVAAFPVADPLARYRMAQTHSIQRLLVAHDAYWPDEESMGEGNPQRLIERGEAERLPPLLVLQGTADANVTGEMAQHFVDVYRSAGGEAALELFEGEPHAFIDRAPDSAATQRALELIVAFVSSSAVAR